MTRQLSARAETWPLARPFTIARGRKIAAEVVVACIDDGDDGRGWGECVPYPRYGETIEGCLAAIEGVRPAIAAGITRADLAGLLPPGAARNAVDGALWDLEAKRRGCRAWDLAGRDPPQPAATVETVSLDTPDAMAEAAARLASRPVIKIKLDADDVAGRVAAVRRAAPRARLIVDANESWSAALLVAAAPALADLGVEMIEQPLPADADDVLADLPAPLPLLLCADESCHSRDDLDRIIGRYDMINVKLDKTGGLTEALALVAEASGRGLELMVGCMVATSLAMAPAMVFAGAARYIDLDGPLWLTRDRSPTMVSADGCVRPPAPALWG